MPRDVLYTLRHVGGLLYGTIVEIVRDEDGSQRLVVQELHVVPGYSGGSGRVEEVEPE